MTDQLPEVGSVWRHNETGETRIITELSQFCVAVYYISTSHNHRRESLRKWQQWAASAIRIDQSADRIIAERDRQWMEAIHPGNTGTDFGRVFGVPEQYAKYEKVRLDLDRQMDNQSYAKLQGRATTIRRLLAAAPPPLTLEEADHIANIMVAYPLDPDGDVNLAIRKRAEWLRDYINGRGRHE